jgi:uncharacterized protein (TIGR03437 family)
MLFRLVGLTLIVAGLGFAQTSPLAIVSSASYQARIAPDSIATAFGSGLADSAVDAALGSDGQLPLELVGTTIEVSGRLARLIYVSPTQASFIVPVETSIGTATVILRASGGKVFQGSVEVGSIAPALYASDATGQGPGAIQNGATYAEAPFRTETIENSGGDKRTRLAIYATGVRGAKNLRVTTNGQDLAVEYYGPAPGYFGLDQICVVLPPEFDSDATYPVRVVAEFQTSNEVTFRMERLADSAVRPAFVYFDRATFNAGDTATGTVQLNGKARGDGLRVNLQLDKSGATYPALVVAATGSTSATFTVQTTSLLAGTTVTATATAGSNSASGSFDVLNAVAANLTNISAPNTINAGSSASGQLTLDRPADGAGVTVALSSSSTSVQVPATVNFAPGQTSANFTIDTNSVGATETVTIQASLRGTTKTASLTLKAALVLAVATDRLSSGSQTTATITLAAPAPSSGAHVTLSSSTTSLQMPAFVDIASGQSTAQFAIQALAVNATVTATVSATYAGATVSQQLTISPAGAVLLDTLTLSAESVKGGTPLQATVRLSLPAGPGGATVTLRSSSPFVFVPPSITIPSGQAQASGTITTFTVPSAQTVTITATASGVSKTATLRVE